MVGGEQVRAQCEQLVRAEALQLWKRVQTVSRMIAVRVANTNDAVQKLRQHVDRVDGQISAGFKCVEGRPRAGSVLEAPTHPRML